MDGQTDTNPSHYALILYALFKGSTKCWDIIHIWTYTIMTSYFQGTDQTMLAKLHKTHGSHRNYLKPKSDINTSFGLNHFAGVVFYDTRGKLYRGH